MSSKVRAGLYRTTVKAGTFEIRNTGPKSWVVSNMNGRRVGKFETLTDANLWLDQLDRMPASTPAKNYLRDLLAAHEGTELADQIRAYFNGLRAEGALISQAEVSLAITRLERLGRLPRRSAKLPRQRRQAEPVMTKAEALAEARRILAKPRI